ncbi:MAG: A/G-specific adenine glycosylase [Microthrixaceae bacterium]|nr:A/G-specific adenine glycosylase [Microthrixaceae bacterium]
MPSDVVIIAGARRSVLTWWEANRRELPWRDTRDPWAVLVAEVMAQQTQVARVIPRWHDFLDRWPTANALAAAPLADLLRAWQGLGYPRRAANLHRCAVEVTADPSLEGRLPSTLDGLLALPGIGPYTARAVLAFAEEADVGVVDTNTGRILARVVGERLGARAAQAEADRWVPAGEGWAWNQAMLDLGALVCRPTPRCDHCPLAGGCRWALDGWPEPDPATRSAGVSVRQAPYRGSMREARGRVLDALVDGPVAEDRLIAGVAGRLQEAVGSARPSAGPDAISRAATAVEELLGEGLVQASAGHIQLAGEGHPTPAGRADQ